MCVCVRITEGSSVVKFPTTWRVEKPSREVVTVRESQKKEDTVARNVREVANRFVFPMIRGSGGLKRRVRGHAVIGEIKKLRVAVAKHVSVGPLLEAPMSTIARCSSEKHICKSKCTKYTLPSPLFEVGMWTNGTPRWREAVSDHFWKFRCQKMAGRCGAKHICKAKC